MTYYYKPLTPQLRRDINNRMEQGRVEVSISDLHPITKSVVDRAFSVAKDIVACLPDDTIIPIRRQA